MSDNKQRFGVPLSPVAAEAAVFIEQLVQRHVVDPLTEQRWRSFLENEGFLNALESGTLSPYIGRWVASGVNRDKLNRLRRLVPLDGSPTQRTAGNAPETTMEPRAAATRLEPAPNTPRTQLEPSSGAVSVGPAAAPAGKEIQQDVSRGLRIPAPLAQRGMHAVSTLGTGGESIVRLWRDRDGREFAVKLYHPGRTPGYESDIDSDEYRSRFDRKWSVQVIERGYDGEHEQHYEVMEYCSGGTLEQLVGTGPIPDERAIAILKRLVFCVKSLQGDPPKTVHGDIKPTNVLVRDSAQLELVLADFGLTRDLGDRSHYTSHGLGTMAYAAPEAVIDGGAIGIKSDWWSLGQVVYRVLVGRGYFYGDSGVFAVETIRRELISRDPSLAEIDRLRMSEAQRSRWKLLLAGLLTREPENRWGAAEVESWLRGKSPTVHRALDADAAGPVNPAGRTAAVPFAFAGVGEFGTPHELGSAMATHPQQAARMLSGRGTDQLIAWLTDDARTGDDYSELKRHNWDPDAKLCYFIARLAPDAPLAFRSKAIGTPAELRRLAEEQDGAAAEVIAALYENRLLASLRNPGQRSRYGMIDANWNDIVEQAIDAARTRGISLSDNALSHLRRQALLLAAGDSAVADRWVASVRKRVNAPEFSAADEVKWFRDLKRDAGV